jgi:pyruvate formate lyase activating enzyme
MPVCPHGVHQVAGDAHALRREACRACGECVRHCPHHALAIKGYTVTAEELVARAGRMKPFFRHSGGGVTLTGGEITSQAEFAEAVLAGCRSLGIHTAIETSGACAWPTLERLLAHTDLVLYDLKLIDDEAHRYWVGASNRLILENARRLAGRAVQVRIPLIPGVTDTEANLRGLFRFMREADLAHAALLPYNPSAAAKYEWLDLPYSLQAAPQSPAELEGFLALAQEVGIEAVLG